jgi:hypothetical protein
MAGLVRRVGVLIGTVGSVKARRGEAGVVRRGVAWRCRVPCGPVRYGKIGLGKARQGWCGGVGCRELLGGVANSNALTCEQKQSAWVNLSW